MKKRALITGINGMSGSHMADLLLEKDYEVFGMERRHSVKNRDNCKHIENKINWITGDLADQNSLLRALEESQPDEVYNLAAQSFVAESWNTSVQTGDITGLGVLRLLEALRAYKKPVKLYQASSSEMFGATPPGVKGCNENSPFYPRSPYGCAKVFGYWITRNYRESYGMFNCNGILFNHESPRRGLEFVTRKITNGVAKIYLEIEKDIILGNLDSLRDWGHASEYMYAAWLMLQQDKPDDYVIATGISHSIKDFLGLAFDAIGISDWTPYVKQDPKFLRPAEVGHLLGDYSKAEIVLGWQPKKGLKEIVKEMVENDIELLKNQLNHNYNKHEA